MNRYKYIKGEKRKDPFLLKRKMLRSLYKSVEDLHRVNLVASIKEQYKAYHDLFGKESYDIKMAFLEVHLKTDRGREKVLLNIKNAIDGIPTNEQI